LDIIYNNFVKPYGISYSDYGNVMKSYDWWNRARVQFKYGSTRSVYGTPSFFVNGVQVPDGDSKSFADWKKLFDQLKLNKF